MSFGFNVFKTGMFKAGFDLQEAGLDVRVILVMTDTTIATEFAAQVLSDFSTLDEYDGANYARKAIGSQVVTEDDGTNKGIFDGSDVTFTALGVGSRQCQGMLLYAHIGADSANIPIAYIDTGGFPFDGNGGDVTVQWNVDGIAQST